MKCGGSCTSKTLFTCFDTSKLKVPIDAAFITISLPCLHFVAVQLVLFIFIIYYKYYILYLKYTHGCHMTLEALVAVAG